MNVLIDLGFVTE